MGWLMFRDLNSECGKIFTALPVSILKFICVFCGPTCNWANARSGESETLEKALTVSIKYS